MKLYEGPSLTWIAEDRTGQLYKFPAEYAGWQQRTLWRGDRASLREAPAYNAHSTGWPGAKGADAGLS